jgi:hypothetical protein
MTYQCIAIGQFSYIYRRGPIYSCLYALKLLRSEAPLHTGHVFTTKTGCGCLPTRPETEKRRTLGERILCIKYCLNQWYNAVPRRGQGQKTKGRAQMRTSEPLIEYTHLDEEMDKD